MFNKDFFPTPLEVIETMTEGEILNDKVILEPSAGKGDIVDFLINSGAKSVLACENNEDLKKILQTKCRVIESDFLTLSGDSISHIDMIVMNPPFSADERHILHAFNIAPAGCKIIALCNLSTLENPYTSTRKELKKVIENYGEWQDLGDCFSEAERKTGVKVALIKIKKAGENTKNEFEGFFMDADPEEIQENGLISYNVVRDLVNRYVKAVQIYSEVLTVKRRLNDVTGSFFGDDLGISLTLNYEEYKKALQKSGWAFILNKMNLTKYTTRGVREDINKFVEQQMNIPFTMRNIYHMLDMVVQTAGQRMDKSILEVFDRVTEHHHDNRYNVKGWKTNSHFLVGKKFILPNIISPAKEYGYTTGYYTSLRNSYDGLIPDFEKALCYVTGKNYDELNTVNSRINRTVYGEWQDSDFFKFKGYKNGNMHFEFVSNEVWELFNKRVSKLKGYPLYENKEQTDYQKRQTGRASDSKPTPKKEPVILATIKIEPA
jgi:predicted RNA methylase